MSLVGPRPHATHMKVGDRYYQDAVRGYAGRHRVKPGSPGLRRSKASAAKSGQSSAPNCAWNTTRRYIENWSIWLDLGILVATVRAVLYDTDAY